MENGLVLRIRRYTGEEKMTEEEKIDVICEGLISDGPIKIPEEVYSVLKENDLLRQKEEKEESLKKDAEKKERIRQKKIKAIIIWFHRLYQSLYKDRFFERASLDWIYLGNDLFLDCKGSVGYCNATGDFEKVFEVFPRVSVGYDAFDFSAKKLSEASVNFVCFSIDKLFGIITDPGHKEIWEGIKQTVRGQLAGCFDKERLNLEKFTKG